MITLSLLVTYCMIIITDIIMDVISLSLRMHAINTWTYPRYILRIRLTHIIYFSWRRSIMSWLSPLNTKTFLWGNQGLQMTRTWHRRQILEENVEFFAINVCSVNLLVFTVPQPPIHLNFKVVNLNALTFSSDFPGDTNSNIKGSTTLRSFPVRALWY